MASLRDDILGGDLRVFYLVWLTTVESGEAPDDAIEPLAGIAPLTPTLEAFAQFFCIDGDLLAAAADATPAPFIAEPPRSAVMKTIDGLSQREKADYLLRLYDGDPHLRTDLRRRCRGCMTSLEDRQTRRSVAELRANACKLADDRRRIEAERIQVEQRRREQQEARAKKRRLDELAQRGEAAWSDVESLITFRNIPAYEKTVALLGDLRDLSLRQGTDDDFHHRLVQLRTRHKAKPRLVERLTAAGLD